MSITVCVRDYLSTRDRLHIWRYTEYMYSWNTSRKFSLSRVHGLATFYAPWLEFWEKKPLYSIQGWNVMVALIIGTLKTSNSCPLQECYVASLNSLKLDILLTLRHSDKCQGNIWLVLRVLCYFNNLSVISQLGSRRSPIMVKNWCNVLSM